MTMTTPLRPCDADALYEAAVQREMREEAMTTEPLTRGTLGMNLVADGLGADLLGQPTHYFGGYDIDKMTAEICVGPYTPGARGKRTTVRCVVDGDNWIIPGFRCMKGNRVVYMTVREKGESV